MNRWVDLDSGAAIGQVAQLVEQGTENPRVGGSIPPLAIRSQLVSPPSLRARVSEPVWGAGKALIVPVLSRFVINAASFAAPSRRSASATIA